mmetsp:Transcript_106363/g.300937  ORF Transcript_106363/g.300937 Transcript_106363/m.300937 type:complete len:309 (+) Transcript_106363:1610-2536(+)
MLGHPEPLDKVRAHRQQRHARLGGRVQLVQVVPADNLGSAAERGRGIPDARCVCHEAVVWNEDPLLEARQQVGVPELHAPPAALRAHPMELRVRPHEAGQVGALLLQGVQARQDLVGVCSAHAQDLDEELLQGRGGARLQRDPVAPDPGGGVVPHAGRAVAPLARPGRRRGRPGDEEEPLLLECDPEVHDLGGAAVALLQELVHRSAHALGLAVVQRAREGGRRGIAQRPEEGEALIGRQVVPHAHVLHEAAAELGIVPAEVDLVTERGKACAFVRQEDTVTRRSRTYTRDKNRRRGYQRGPHLPAAA